MRLLTTALATLSLLLCSCQKKPAPPLAAPPNPTAAPAATLPPTSTPRPSASVRATPEQLGSVLRVRVAFGGLPPLDMAAALLHHDEIPDPSLANGHARFVMALLKGWRETQLRSPSAHIIIYRNKVDANGRPATEAFVAHLVQYDGATGLGVLTYGDSFDASNDVGFRLPHGNPAGTGFTALRTSYDPTAPLPVPERSPFYGARPPAGSNGNQPFTVDAGVYQGSDGSRAAAAWPTPPVPAVADPVQLLLDTPDRLAGFAETTPAGGEITSVGAFTVALRVPTIEPTKVTFESEGTESQFRVVLTLDPAADETLLKHLRLRSLALPPGAEPPLPNASGSYAPISGSAVPLGRTYAADGSSWSAHLSQPAVGQEQLYLLQLSWPLLPQNDAPEICGRPFFLKVERRADGLYPAVTGIPGVATDPSSETASATKFPLETAAKEVHLVAGGREAILQMYGAPYWKRFSFEKNAWLPLPGKLANVAVTGNLNAIFILDRASKEVRKFRLPNLEPAGVTKLPSADNTTILAGGDSAHAPVHVLGAKGPQALDPDTLQRRDVPRDPKQNASRWFTPASDESVAYSITGDGLAIWRLDRNFERLFSYNGDSRGLETSYLGASLQVSGGVAGVSGGFTVDDVLSCLDVPGGRAIRQDRVAAPWANSRAALSENSPTVLRFLLPRSNDVPPRPPRLGCFAFSSATPYADVEVPELTGLLEAQTSLAWKTQRWAFIDPYSQQVATLSTDRRTWYVRKLAPEGGHLQPALLNWPDTSVARGDKFSFQPQLVGKAKFAAALHGRTEPPVAVNETAGTLDLPIAPNEFDTLELLDFTVSRENAPTLAYPMILHVAGPGPAMPFVAPPATPVEGLDLRGMGLASLGETPNKDLHPVAATFLRFTDPVTSIVGATAGHAVLLRANNHLDFLSLQTRRIAGSMVGPPGAWYYPAAGALLEYDPGKRTLSRINVPAGRYEQVLPFPAGVELVGIGAGVTPDSPVTLALQINQGGAVERFADLTVSTIAFHNNFVVLNARTLRANGRAQPATIWQFLGQKGNENNHPFVGFIGTGGSKPVVLPTSRNGALVYLPQYFLALGPSYAVAYPFGNDPLGIDLAHNNAELSGGSMSGLMAFAATGQAYKGGIKVGDAPGWMDMGASPDGRYQFRRVMTQPNANCVVDVRLAESGLPLIRMARLAFMEDDNFRVGGRRAAMLGDGGPLAILSPSGEAMEMVELNISDAAKALAPGEFHVTSQPVPVVMEGQSTQYQVSVNNPGAVQSYRLVSTSLGASLSPTGLLSYRAPNSITGPTHETISIEIRGRSGQVVLHEFPIYVLPTMRASAKLNGGQI